jgi:hypothetical protein
MPTADTVERWLATSHGFSVVASDGVVGEVQTPLFPPDYDEPDYLVIQIGTPRRRRPVVSTALVERVDAGRRLVFVRAVANELSRLPEHLPLAISCQTRHQEPESHQLWRILP